MGEAVTKRRQELGLSRAALARESGVHVDTLRALERDERWPQDTNRAKIERALNWQPGALDAIKNGESPVESVATPVPLVVDKPATDDEQRRDAAGQPRADLGSLRESMRNLDELPGFVQAVILAQAEEELPRAIAALDEARRVELVRAAFALWDAQDGLGGAGAGVAGGRNRAGAADGAAAAPHAGVRRAVNERATGN